jgi:hypothetical protein
MAQEFQESEDRLNREAAISLAPVVWNRVAKTVYAKCHEWNAITNEQTLTCKETPLGDLRILCAGRNHQITVQFNSQKRVVIIKNTARRQNESDTVLSIAGYPSSSGRDAHLISNNMPVNLDMLIVGHLRLLAGLTQEVR